MITSRPLAVDDAAAVLELLHAYDRRWFGEPVLALADLEASWRDPGLDLRKDSEGWTEDGVLVAFGTLHPRGGIEIAVDETWGGAGLEDVLLDRWERQAAERGLRSVHRDLASADVESRDRLLGRGWVVAHTGWLLSLPPQVDLPERALTEGDEVRAMTKADLSAAYAVIRDAFAEWQEEQRSYEAWRAALMDRPDTDLAHCRVATSGDAVVGACVVLDPTLGAALPEAFVAQLAVHRDHRGRGLARELLASSARAARARGVPGLGLYTSARTGALGLYEHLGMTVRQTLVEYELEL